jgi:hypothetical protein
MNRNAISAGVGMLKADADSCILPGDRTRQKHLGEAARVLAAAPAMLAALRQAAEFLREEHGDGPTVRACYAAIAKAEGKP